VTNTGFEKYRLYAVSSTRTERIPIEVHNLSVQLKPDAVCIDVSETLRAEGGTRIANFLKWLTTRLRHARIGSIVILDPSIVGEETISRTYDVFQFVYRLEFKMPEGGFYYLKRNRVVDYVKIKRRGIRDYVRPLREEGITVESEPKFLAGLVGVTGHGN
jgi:hypothetical protein